MRINVHHFLERLQHLDAQFLVLFLHQLFRVLNQLADEAATFADFPRNGVVEEERLRLVQHVDQGGELGQHQGFQLLLQQRHDVLEGVDDGAIVAVVGLLLITTATRKWTSRCRRCCGVSRNIPRRTGRPGGTEPNATVLIQQRLLLEHVQHLRLQLIRYGNPSRLGDVHQGVQAIFHVDSLGQRQPGASAQPVDTLQRLDEHRLMRLNDRTLVAVRRVEEDGDEVDDGGGDVALHGEVGVRPVVRRTGHAGDVYEEVLQQRPDVIGVVDLLHLHLRVDEAVGEKVNVRLLHLGDAVLVLHHHENVVQGEQRVALHLGEGVLSLRAAGQQFY